MIEDIRYSKKINWIVFAFFAVLMAALLFWFDRAWGDDAAAVQIAQKTFQAMGGMDQWKATAAVRFDFVVDVKGNPPRSVKHLWDRKNSRDHVEWSRDGKTTIAWVDLRTRSGSAWQDDKKLDGEALQKALDTAYGRWINDTYWLIMPFKLLDPGVILTHEGEKDGYDVLHLSFQKVGMTPRDQYWAYVNKTTGLMDRWEYLLEDEKEKESWNWKEWGQYGALKLSKWKESPDGKTRIGFEPLQILDSADPALFGEELKTLD